MRLRTPIALAVTLSLLAPAASLGAVTIGSNLFAGERASKTGTFMNFSSCTGGTPCTYAQVTPLPPADTAPGGLASPIDGVITNWLVTGGSAGGAVKLRVLRPTGAGTFTAVGTSAPGTTGTRQFRAALPVRKGDLLGIDNSSDALLFAPEPQAASYYWSPQLADGSNRTANATQGPLELLVQADVEPDADCDGLGDESQDPDTADGPCRRTDPGGGGGGGPVGGVDVVAPRISPLTTSPRRPRARGRVTFTYSLSEPSRAVLTVERRVHGRRHSRTLLAGTVARSAAAGRTRSRFRLRAPGTYRATLVATDAAGNVSLPRTVRLRARRARRG